MTVQFLTYDLPLSAAPGTLGQGLDQILVSLGAIDLIDVDITAPQGAPDRPTRTALITYLTPGATRYRAEVFGDDTPDGDAAAAEAFFTTYPAKAGLRLFDVSTLDLGKLRRGRLLALFTDAQWVGTPLPSQQQLFIATVTAVGGIAGGASGAVAQVFGDLTLGSAMTARNPTALAAAQSTYGYAYVDPVSGDLLFFPSCI